LGPQRTSPNLPNVPIAPERPLAQRLARCRLQPALLASRLDYPILQIDPHGDNGHMGHKNRMKLPFRTSPDAAGQYLGRLQSRNYSVREFL
jgi:hypothetical protein